MAVNPGPGKADIQCCAGCFLRLGISCAWCGHPIMLGDPITLYQPKDGLEHMPNSATYEGAWVGCMRMGCADTGADRAGFWVADEKFEKGMVKRVPTAFEMMGTMLAMGKQPTMIIIPDLFEQPDLPPVSPPPQKPNIIIPPHPEWN
jgi:hypothetical protein